jgi:protein-S-isoprenylcysteine O-methyltransferase Ste14
MGQPLGGKEWVNNLVRGFAITSLYLGTLIAILFISAGRLNWAMGWATLGIYIVISFSSLFLADPELVKERSQIRPGTNSRDTVLASVSFIFFYPFTLAVAGVDVCRFGWSTSIPWAIQVVALAIFALGNGIGLWAVLSNRYFSTFMRDQQDRGQVVVREGPYRYVRHPGYAGTIMAAVVLPVALGSLWAMIPGAIGAAGFVLRTVLEDKILIEELSGYKEYAREVRYRLIPGIW